MSPISLSAKVNFIPKIFQVSQMMNQKVNFHAILIILAILLATSCNSEKTSSGEIAATVNGKAIKMEEVERLIRSQLRGEEKKLSQLEIAQARLQALDLLIQREVLYQKAQKENLVPKDEEITAEINKRKTESKLSQEEFEKMLKEANETEASLRESVMKELAIEKLNDKITGRIESPKESEIQAFFESNKELFKSKRGAQLAVIVIDPQKTSEQDTTTNQVEAQQKAKELGERLLRGADFATVARENSEDVQTALRGGDWRYFTEEELKQAFGNAIADYIMNKMNVGDIIPQIVPFEGKYLIVKLQRRQEKDEDQTLDSPGVRQQITDILVNTRKQLLLQAYMAVAMDEARIENFLAKKIIENPNELSGARPIVAETPTPEASQQISNTNAQISNTNATNNSTKSNVNTKSNADSNTKSKR
jgi:parvulin-like peptidyl-prolyl isomerase